MLHWGEGNQEEDEGEIETHFRWIAKERLVRSLYHRLRGVDRLLKI